MPTTTTDAVDNGAAFLDNAAAAGKIPQNWRELIDLPRLDVNLGDRCILGLLDAHTTTTGDDFACWPYDRMCNHLGLDSDTAAYNGFCVNPRSPYTYPQLTTAWRLLLTR